MNTITRLATTCLTALTLTAAPALAEKLTLATIAPDKSIWGVQAKRFVEAIEASGADIEIEYFGNAQLGNMADTFKNTLSGRVDIWIGAMPVMASVTPELALFNLPYLYDDIEQAKCAVPQLTDKVRELVGGKYHVLAVVPVDTQDISATQPIRLPSDLEGLKVRSSPTPASMTFFRELGATPQPLPAAETTSALATGLVDALDFGATYLFLTGAYKTAKYYTPTSHNYNLGAYIISARAWARLSDEQKNALQSAADSLDFKALADEVQAFEDAMEARLVEGGAERVELTEEERAAWVDAGRAAWPAIIEGPRGDTEGMMAAIDAARASCTQ